MKSKPIAQRFASKVAIRENGCHEWTGCLMPNGYGQIHVNRKTGYAHRVAYELANGPLPSGLFVLHRCDNRKCVNPEHLFLGTFDDNMADMVAKTRQAAGSRNWHAKLDEDAAIRIRRDSRPSHVVAMEYGVSRPTICDIRSRRTWRHI